MVAADARSIASARSDLRHPRAKHAVSLSISRHGGLGDEGARMEQCRPPRPPAQRSDVESRRSPMPPREIPRRHARPPCGDALGTTLESVRRERSTDRRHRGEGGVRPRPGQWTAIPPGACLAASVVETGGRTARAACALRALVEERYMSSTGRCFDIGNTPRRLARFEGREILLGSPTRIRGTGR